MLRYDTDHVRTCSPHRLTTNIATSGDPPLNENIAFHWYFSRTHTSSIQNTSRLENQTFKSICIISGIYETRRFNGAFAAWYRLTRPIGIFLCSKLIDGNAIQSLEIQIQGRSGSEWRTATRENQSINPKSPTHGSVQRRRTIRRRCPIPNPKHKAAKQTKFTDSYIRRIRRDALEKSGFGRILDIGWQSHPMPGDLLSQNNRRELAHGWRLRRAHQLDERWHDLAVFGQFPDLLLCCLPRIVVRHHKLQQ